MRFETIACPVCDSADHSLHIEVGDRFRTLPGQSYTVVRCNGCGLLFLNPRPDSSSIGEFYAAEGYDPFISSSDSRSLKAFAYRGVRSVSVRRKASRVTEGLKTGGKALDVGCATGEFLLELRRRGFQTFGVEPDPKAAEFARSVQGLDVRTGSIEAVLPGSGPFDLITLWHVLEHVHDLRGMLERLKELLAADGRLAIAVPNPLSSDAAAYGAAWVAWDAPRHLYHFEPAVMLDLLTRAGFRAERRGAVAFDAFYHSLLSESPSAAGTLRAGWRGLSSFVRGVGGGEGSSELYFAHQR